MCATNFFKDKSLKGFCFVTQDDFVRVSFLTFKFIFDLFFALLNGESNSVMKSMKIRVLMGVRRLAMLQPEGIKDIGKIGIEELSVEEIGFRADKLGNGEGTRFIDNHSDRSGRLKEREKGFNLGRKS